MKIHEQKLKNRLAAEYVLGHMPRLTRLRFENMLRHDFSLQQHVDLWSNKLVTMHMLLRPVQPPARVWAGIERELRTRHTRPQRMSWGGMASLVTFCLVLLASTLWYVQVRLPSMPMVIAVIQDQQEKSAWLVATDTKRDMLRVRPVRSQVLPSDKDFELWLLPSPQAAPISLGLLHGSNSSNLKLRIQHLAKIQPASALAVSIEPRGGSPIGLPTGKVAYQGHWMEF